MATTKDICRICLQESDYDEVQEINLNKLKELIAIHLLPEWDFHLFHGHIICNTCIVNFRTMRSLCKHAWKSNAILMRLKNKSKKYRLAKTKNLLDLKQLDKYQNMEGEFLVCRLCLEPTKHVAVYLSDGPPSIIPGAFITMMLKTIRLFMALIDKTLNPVLCYQCWQRVQVSFSFRKHLNIVKDKLEHYQRLVSKIYIDKEDLADILHMWDKLGPSNSNENIPLESDSSDSNLELPEEKKSPKNMPSLKPQYACYEEHNYFNKTLLMNPSRTSPKIKRRVLNRNSFKNVGSDMPVLTPSVAQDLKELKNLSVSDRSLRSRRPVSYVYHDIMRNVKKTTTTKKPLNGNNALSKNMKNLVSILKSKTERREEPNNTLGKINSVPISPKRNTRLAAKKDDSRDFNSQDLLVLKREEIIKKKPIGNIKSTPPASTSRPKTKSLAQPRKSPAKQCNSNEYTFERLNFDNEIQNDQTPIEDEEIQIKKEIVSDSDDDFTETGPNFTNDEGEEEQCPNLDVFIKTEPEEIVDLNEDEPPELEFQGPCVYEPQFVISNTFTVNDKQRHMVYTLDEKRNLMNSISDGLQGRAMEVPGDKDVSSGKRLGGKLINGPAENNLVKTNVDKDLRKSSLLKDVVIKLTKCDQKPLLESNQPNTPPSGVITRKDTLTVLSAPTAWHAPAPMQLEPNHPQIISSAGRTEFKQTESITIRNPCTVVTETITTESSRAFAGETKRKRRSMEKSLYLGKHYTKIDQMFISKEHPFMCEQCDFLTHFKKAAKCHVALHATNQIYLYVCEKCSFRTAKQKNYRTHVAKEHAVDTYTSPLVEPLCGVCRLVVGACKTKCVSCRMLYHPDCLLRNETMQSVCGHFSVTGCKSISVDGHVSMVEGQRGQKICLFCLKYVGYNWINCKQCNRYFHYRCFFLSRNHPRSLCRHIIAPASVTRGKSNYQNGLTSESSSNNQEQAKEDKRKCEFCYKKLDHVIPCPNCMKFMHYACYVRDSKHMKFNCKHVDIVGEDPPVSLCEYCGLSTERNSIVCRRCNRTLHRSCFVVDRIKKTLNCEHFAETDVMAIRKKPYLNDDAGCSKDTQTPAMAQSAPSTSKEVKREMLDLSTFIMLCD